MQADGQPSAPLRGVCPGSSLSQMVGGLGAPVGQSVSMDGSNVYPVAADGCWLEIEMAHSAVRSLAIRCEP